MKRLLTVIGLLTLLVPDTIALAQKTPTVSPPDGEAAVESSVQGPADTPDGPEEEALRPKSNRRPYTETQFDLENMTEIEMESYQKIARIRENSIEKMIQLVTTTPNYPNLATILYRIAEYMTENTRFNIAMQARQYRRDVQRFQAGDLPEAPEPPVKDYSRTLPFYKDILIEHPDYDRVEEVLFYLGRNGVDTGRSKGDDALVDESISYFDKLESLFPGSRFLPNAFLMAGEYNFDRNNLFDAMKYYKKIVDNHKISSMYLYSLYKLGWVYYNYQQHDKALAAFEEVIRTLREKGDATATLREMTYTDYVITMSEAGFGWESARDFLTAEFGEARAMEALHDLATRLRENGFHDDAISLYTYFIGLNQVGPRVLEYWNQILEVYRLAYPFDETEKKIREARLFFRNDGAWYQANQANTASVSAVEDFMVKWDLALAEYYLSEGLYFGKGDEAFHMAINRFRDILKGGAAGRVEQAYAGILMSYVGLIRLNSRGRIIYIAENVLGPAFPDDYKLPRKMIEAKLSDIEIGFLEAKGEYLALPDRKGQKPDLNPLAAVDMESSFLYTSALLYYLSGQPERGLEDIDRLLARSVTGVYAGYCTEMTFQMSSRTRQWDGLVRRMKALLDGGDFTVTPRESLLDRMCEGLIQHALTLADGGAAGDAMERLTTAASRCSSLVERGGEALYQLGVVAEKGGFVEQARKAYQRVMDEFGRSRYRNMASRRQQQLKGK